MSTTTSSSDVLAAHARGYAQAVRLHLSDLAPDVVDDLTDGLEADLAEALLDDQGFEPAADAAAEAAGTRPFDLAARFGPAAEYAAEMRTAAGLPVATAVPDERRRRAGAVAEAWSARVERWREFWRPMTSHPAWDASTSFLGAIAPAWWILRGWVGAQVILWPLGMSGVALWPGSTPGRVLVVAAVVVSVQWGRGQWLPRWTWFPRVVGVASVAAALVAIPLVAEVVADSSRPSGTYDAGYDSGWNDGYGSTQVSQVGAGGGPGADGVWVDGIQVSNIFAYDTSGDPIRDVQLYDDRGRPVRTIADDMAWNTWTVPDVAGSWNFQPAISSDGRSRWNVFPLSAVSADEVGLGDSGSSGYADPGEEEYPHPPTGVQAQEMPWPFLKAPTAFDDDAPTAPDDDAPTAPDGKASTAPDDDAPDQSGSGAADSDERESRNAPSSSRTASDAGEDRPADRPVVGEVSDVVPTLEATQAD